MKMPRLTTSLIAPSVMAMALALPVAGPALAAPGSVRDFQLPPAPTPTPTTPQAQGPIDPDAPVPVRPRPIETATPAPSPSVTLPAPEPTATEAAPTGSGTASPTPAPTRTATQQRPAPPRATQPVGPTPEITQAPDNAETGADLPVLPEAEPTPAATTPAISADEPMDLPWLWIALGGLLALAIAAGAFFWKRRESTATVAPIIEPPKPKQPAAEDTPEPVEAPLRITPTAPAEPAAPVIPAAIGKGFALHIEAVKLSRSMMNASLSYRVTVSNQTNRTIAGLELGGELISAANGTPVSQQLANPGTPLPTRHSVDQIAPGGSESFEGTLLLPLREINPIRQGNAALYVPLMRWRAAARDGIDPIAQTYVVGQRPGQAGGKLQPFPLDKQLRSFDQIGQRALD